MRAVSTSIVALLLVSGCSEYELSGKEPVIEAGVPVIQVNPSAIDFGEVRAGQVETGFFQIENVGEAPLELGDLTIDGSEAFTLVTEAHGARLEVGEAIDAMVEYLGTEEGDVGTVLIPSNDDATPVAQVQLMGGIAASSKPVAVCSADPAEIDAISGSSTLIGDQSYDPGGLALTSYTWNGVMRPAGSTATVPAGNEAQPNRPGFVADMVGTYGFELVVVNENGFASDPCFVEVEAIPAEDLWVEMFWTESGDDMDLHVTRAGGNLRSGQDCYYLNCVGGRDWGNAGAVNNPALDLDDIPNTGPENINVNTPENVVYGVWVHDYPGSVHQGGNDVTVNIYLGGSLAWSDTRTISGEDSDNHFADVDWATQTVTAQ